MKLETTSNRVVVEIIDESKMTDTGIFIAKIVEERTSKARVLFTGPGRKSKYGNILPMSVAAGDVVLYTTGAGRKMTMGNQEILILTEDDIVGLVDE